jgi:hypothetical protein
MSAARFIAMPLLLTALVGCGAPGFLAGNTIAAGTALAAGHHDELERERTVEVKIFLKQSAYDRLLKAYYEKGLIETKTAMVSYYFDAFDPASGQFALQHGPDGGAKFRYRVKERLGKEPKPVLQTKSRFRPTFFSNVSQIPFSARFSEEVSQDADKSAVTTLQARAEAADHAFRSGEAGAPFFQAAHEAGQAFVALPGAFSGLFGKALGAAGGEAKDVTFAGALYNTRDRAEDQTTPKGLSYEFEFDAYQLSVAPGKMGTEYAVEADFEPGQTDAETDARLKEVVLDVAGRLLPMQLPPDEAIDPKNALSDPLGPNGGYMGPIAKALKEAKRR